MKIISLKGQNLASLAAPFDINFASGILADAGLFAICGNTGSGKSTLLDAICLSLFDAMPRFSSARRGPAIGHSQTQESERLKSNDVRHILTRGAASAFSEVIFELEDQRQFCARWSVKRARNSATGRIQAQEMSLTALASDKVIATKKTEVLAAIEQLIGLNYDQFRRSVLLAQGDFAAFLKAPAKERSELLERITGTKLYSALSKLAFARAKEEEQQLTLLTERQGEVTLLSSQEQQQLIAQLGQINESMSGMNNQASQLQWLEQCLTKSKHIEQQLVETTEQCAIAEQTLVSQQPLAQKIEQVEHAQRARTVDEQIVATKLQQRQQAEQLVALDATLTSGQQNVTEISQQVSQLSNAKGQAAVDLEQQLPLLESAVMRQLEMNNLQQIYHEKHQQLTDTEQQQHVITRRLTGNEANQQRQASLLNTLAIDLAQQQHISGVVNHITLLEQGINDHQQAATNFAQYAQQMANIKITATEAQQQLQQFNQQLQQQSAHQQGYQQQIQAYGLSSSEPAIAALEQQLEHHQQQLTQLATSQQQVTQALQYQSMVTVKQQHYQETTAQLEQTKIDYHARRQQREQLLPAVQEAEHALLNAQQIMSLSEHRSQLVPHQACALCGSTEHPYAGEVNLGERLVDQLSERYKKLQQQSHELTSALSQLEAVGNQLNEQQRTIAAEVDELNGLLQALSKQSITPQLLAQIEHDMARVQQQLAHDKQQHQALLETAEQRRALEQQLLESQHQIDLVNQSIEQCQQQLQSCNNDLALNNQYQDQLNGQMQARVNQLTELYPQANWSQLLHQPEQLESFKKKLATDIEQFIEKSNYQGQLNTEQNELEQQHIALTQEFNHFESVLQPLKQQLTQAQQQINQWQQEIDSVCQGQDPKQLKTELMSHFEQLTTAFHNAEQALVTAKNQLLVIQNQQQQISGQAQDLATKLSQLTEQWQQWLTQLNLSHEQLVELLAYDHQWIIEQRQHQAQVLQQHHQLQAILAEQQRSLAQLRDELASHHQQLLGALPQLAPEPAQSSSEQRNMLKQSIEAAIKQQEQQQFELRSGLERHNQAMIRHGELQQEIELQRNDAHLWIEMRELIGSADGSKFRTFAQSLTLEQMLVSANHHLKELAPRYQLQRVPGAELDLQVIDQDMGDDVRSVESLSGGETFLVSLALALGLGSITSLQTHIKTLFIDEGFGTLDPDTLEIALSCLDSLQASGRQIGLISHVQGLVERVGTRVQITAQGNGHSNVELFAR